MKRLVSLLFFCGFLVVAALTIYAINLKLAYNATFPANFNQEIADWTFGMFLTSMVGVGFSVLGLYWVRETLIATRATAKSAQDANEITRDSIETAERAWVVSKIIPVGAIQSDTNGWSMPIEVENKNIGKTPALDVSTWVVASNIKNIARNVDEMRREVAKNRPDNGIMLAPGAFFNRPWHFSSDMRVNYNQPADEGAEFIVCCVTYRTIFDDDLHHTITVVNVSRRNWPESGMASGIEDGTPPAEIFLWPWVGSFAD